MLIYNLSLKQNYVVLESQTATFIEFLPCVNCFVARKDMVLWPLTLCGTFSLNPHIHVTGDGNHAFWDSPVRVPCQNWH